MLASLWPVIVSAIIVISSFAIMKTTLDAHEKAIELNTEEHKKIDFRITRLEDSISLIPEMRNDIKTLLLRRK